jgi:hypothetical protein
MQFQIVLSYNEEPVETMNSWVDVDNDFGVAAMMASLALFRNKDANNVHCARILSGGTVSDERFFYGEKF